MSVTVRFAPSPTGRLHAGNIRTALINYFFARKQGGTFILRLDDTDRERSTKEFADGIQEDVAWLGIAWAKLVHQSDRFALYEAAVEQLKEMGRLYPAYETPDELELQRKRQLARGKPIDLPVVVIGSVVLSLLVVTRLSGLVRSKERTAERERVLREVGATLVVATSRDEILALFIDDDIRAEKTLIGTTLSPR